MDNKSDIIGMSFFSLPLEIRANEINTIVTIVLSPNVVHVTDDNMSKEGNEKNYSKT